MTNPTLDPEVLGKWIGNSEQREDVVRLQPARFMQATLDRAPSLEQGDSLPLGWHWLYFLEARPMSELGRDGHPAVGGFLPPVALPRRMWAGSRLEFHQPVKIGDTLKKISTIKDLKLKSGKTGKLCFVTVSHIFFREQLKLITEEHDIVYREDPAPGAPPPSPPKAPTDAQVKKPVSPSPILLYRYSFQGPIKNPLRHRLLPRRRGLSWIGVSWSAKRHSASGLGIRSCHRRTNFKLRIPRRQPLIC